MTNFYKRQLHRRIVNATELGDEAEVSVPELGDGYVNPAFRSAVYSRTTKPSEVNWWLEHTSPNDGFQDFLINLLTVPDAAEFPFLILGEPGAGKSLLTKVLAAKLPDAGFYPVHVDLRWVPADAAIPVQIEAGVYNTLSRDVAWSHLSDAAGPEAHVVVLLDGFDEILQRGEASMANYLEKIKEFQDRENDRGRPVVIIVTSRTIVANRARIPVGTNIMRIEPFSEGQIATWLDSWNKANREYFQTSGLAPLTLDAVARQRELASQPLLLLMLALYDADDNALQREMGALASSDLYERLLQKFVGREIRKSQRELEARIQTKSVEEELARLSIAAFAMYNRGSQFVHEDDLNADLAAIFAHVQVVGRQATPTRGGPTPAQLLVGRSFFMHVSTSTTYLGATSVSETYEFLHATFGEHLVARMTYKSLIQLLTTSPDAAASPLGVAEVPDDGLLFALLSSKALTTRTNVLQFIRQMFDHDGTLDRVRLVHCLLVQMKSRLFAVGPTTYTSYSPTNADFTARYAVYSSNLVILIACLMGGKARTSDLHASTGWGFGDWRKLMRLWRACLDDESWDSLITQLQFEKATEETVGTPPLDGAVISLGESTPFKFDPPQFERLYADNRLLADDDAGQILSSITPLTTLGVRAFGDVDRNNSPSGAILSLLMSISGPPPSPRAEENEERSIEEVSFVAASEIARGISDNEAEFYTQLVLRLLRSAALFPAPVRDITATLTVALETAERCNSAMIPALILDCADAYYYRNGTVMQRLKKICSRAAMLLPRKIDSVQDPALLVRIAIFMRKTSQTDQELLRAWRVDKVLSNPSVRQRLLVDGVTLSIALQEVYASRLREWAQVTGFELLGSLPDELLVTVPDVQFRYIDSCAEGAKSPASRVHVRQRKQAAHERLGIPRL